MALFKIGHAVVKSVRMAQRMATPMRDGGGMVESKTAIIKEVLENIRSGRTSINSLDSKTLQELGGKEGLTKYLGGEKDSLRDFGAGKSKSLDIIRRISEQKYGSPEKPEASSEKRSLQSTNGSIHVTESSIRLKQEKADINLYNNNKSADNENILMRVRDTKNIVKTDDIAIKDLSNFNTELIADTRKELNELIADTRKELNELIADMENGRNKVFGESDTQLRELSQNLDDVDKGLKEGLGKKSENALKELEKSADNLENNNNDQGEPSVEHKSFFKKLKETLKVLHDYNNIVGGDNTNVDRFDIATDFDGNSSSNNLGNQRLSLAYQNARKADPKVVSPKQPSAGGQGSTGGWSKYGQNRKIGSYDPVRQDVSEGFIRKPLDPVKNFYHKIDSLDSINNQFKQVNDPAQLPAQLKEYIAKNSGAKIPDEEGSQNSQSNNDGTVLMDSIIGSEGAKKASEKSTVSGASRERSKLGPITNSKLSMVEQSKQSKIEQYSEIPALNDKVYTADTKPLKSNHDNSSQSHAEFFEKKTDQIPHDSLKEGENVQQKEGSSTTQKFMEVETFLENREQINESMHENDIEASIEEERFISDIEKVLVRDNNKEKNEEDKAKVAEQQQRSVELERQREEVEELLQANGRIVRQDGSEKVSQQEIQAEGQMVEAQIQQNEELVNQGGREEFSQQEIQAELEVIESLSKKGEANYYIDELGKFNEKAESVSNIMQENKEFNSQQDLKNNKNLETKEEEQKLSVDKLDEMQAILEEWHHKQQVKETNKDNPEIQALSQISQMDKQEINKVNMDVEEVRQEQGVDKQSKNEEFQVDINHSKNFLDDATVFEKKSSHSKDIRLLQVDGSTGNRVEASVSKEAMLSSDSELSQRKSPTLLIEYKRGGIEKHSLNAEGREKREEHINAKVDEHAGEKLETKLGDSEKQSLIAEVVERRGEKLEAKKSSGIEAVDHGEQKPSSRIEEESSKLASETMDSSSDMSNAEKAKLEFISSFDIKELPEDLHETARKLAERAYKDAQEKKVDLNKYKSQIEEQLKNDKFRTELIEILRLDKERAEEESNESRDRREEVVTATGIEAY